MTPFHIASSRKDATHITVDRRFQELGCSVIEMHATGIPGFPDLSVGCIGVTHFVEIKNRATAYGRAGFNANQTAFNRDWRGEKVWLCANEDEATALVQNWRKAA